MYSVKDSVVVDFKPKWRFASEQVGAIIVRATDKFSTHVLCGCVLDLSLLAI